MTNYHLCHQVTKYTAAITSVWDGDHSGLHLNLKTESTQKYTNIINSNGNSTIRGNFKKNC